MKYTITIERYSFGWLWETSNGFSHYSGFAFTKRGAIWIAERQAKKWAKETLNSLTKESWQVEY